jgi:nicastrin
MAGIVTLLAVAEALGEMKRNGNLRSTENAIMFMFFQGESWDYIGSSRMVYDVINGKFPYQLDTTKEVL